MDDENKGSCSNACSLSSSEITTPAPAPAAPADAVVR